ncbi:unnamed protein product [Durusdinium trenchii]|uniref:Uncharacterized protein n=1 Tax=Durusdinium trenchii TaxID=1381693 RepID=A0ABP0J4G0_9DINO
MPMGSPKQSPRGGLVLLRRLHLNISWSPDVPCHIYIRVPRPPKPLVPTWPLTLTEANRLQEAAKEELVHLGALRLTGAVLSETRFATAVANAWPVAPGAARRLARAFGAPAAALGAQWLGSGRSCRVPSCRLLTGHEESPDVPPQVLRDLGCLRFSDQRTLLHAALGRKDLQLARAALRSQGAGGLFCRDALGRTVLHHGNNTGALQRRVNASEAVSWVLAQMQSNALEMVQEVDHMGRHGGTIMREYERFILRISEVYPLTERRA